MSTFPNPSALFPQQNACLRQYAFLSDFVQHTLPMNSSKKKTK